LVGIAISSTPVIAMMAPTTKTVRINMVEPFPITLILSTMNNIISAEILALI
jgi:hypothetical protein